MVIIGVIGLSVQVENISFRVDCRAERVADFTSFLLWVSTELGLTT